MAGRGVQAVMGSEEVRVYLLVSGGGVKDCQVLRVVGIVVVAEEDIEAVEEEAIEAMDKEGYSSMHKV